MPAITDRSLSAAARQPAIVGVILAGGQSLRMGRDKSQVLLKGQPLIDWVSQRLAPQVGQIIISLPHAACPFSNIAWPQLTDLQAGLGPLAGIQRSLLWLEQNDGQYLLSTSCDTPFIPPDFAATLCQQLSHNKVELLHACWQQQNHYLHSLWPVSLLPRVTEYLNNGGRSVKGFMAQVATRAVDFQPAKMADPFANLNTPEDLAFWRGVLEQDL